MITKQLLEKSGYKEYGANNLIFPHADSFFQKRIKSRNKTLYYIEFLHYPRVGHFTEAWESNLHINEPHYRFKISHPKSISEVEKKYRAFFNLKELKCKAYAD